MIRPSKEMTGKDKMISPKKTVTKTLKITKIVVQEDGD